MLKICEKTAFKIYGFGAICLSLHAWNHLIVQTLALKLIRALSAFTGWTFLQNLSSALPLKIDQASIFNGSSALIVGTLLLGAACLLLREFSRDFQISNSRLERLRLSVIFAFCYVFALMLISYLSMLSQVMLAGQAIKPFPKQTIGALQYLDALSFLPWAALCALMLFAFSEAALGGHSPGKFSTSKGSPSNNDEDSGHFMAAA